MGRIREPYCRSFKLLSTKMWDFVFYARRQIMGECLFVFFPRGHRIDQVVLECRKWAHSNGNEKF